MKLLESIDKKLEIEQIIFDNDGELDEMTDLDYKAASLQVKNNIDRAVYAYKAKQNNLKNLLLNR